MVVDSSERAAFEAWATDHHFSVETEEGDYIDLATRLAASAYRAGMKAGMDRAASVAMEFRRGAGDPVCGDLAAAIRAESGKV